MKCPFLRNFAKKAFSGYVKCYTQPTYCVLIVLNLVFFCEVFEFLFCSNNPMQLWTFEIQETKTQRVPRRPKLSLGNTFNTLDSTQNWLSDCEFAKQRWFLTFCFAILPTMNMNQRNIVFSVALDTQHSTRSGQGWPSQRKRCSTLKPNKNHWSQRNNTSIAVRTNTEHIWK